MPDLKLEQIVTRATKTADHAAALGATVPKALETALSTYRSAVSHQPDLVDVDAETLAIAPSKVADLIDRAATAHLHRDAVNRVREDVLDRLARRVGRELTAATDAILTALAPSFTEAAARITELHATLPTDWQDPARLLEADEGQVAAFREARALVAVLDAHATVAEALLPSRNRVAQGVRFAVVDHSITADEVAGIDGRGPLGRWGTILDTDGVTGLQWHPTKEDHDTYTSQVPDFVVRQQTHTDHGFRVAEAVVVPA